MRIQLLDFSRLPSDQAAIKYQRFIRELDQKLCKEVKTLEGVLGEIEAFKGQTHD